ncbi:MAG: gliding motility-associated C-terminal domain-containing protein [Bacteroidetes bacterium]|nr:gliding motility-associated C-terminal domain-containing protein [Bacteroidota bacterium]
MNTKFSVFLFLISISFFSKAQITGTVFRDFNNDGIMQLPLEVGVPGVIVDAYDASNTVINTTVSAANGTYSLPFTVPVRVEFEVSGIAPCSNTSADFTGVAVGGNNVRFINANISNENYGVQNPDDYFVTADPLVFLPQFNRGDPLAGGTSAVAPAFYAHPYSLSGGGISPYQLPASNVGAVWGVAYSKQAKKVFTSAFMKRFSGLGPLGSGGIYLLEPAGASFTVTNFYDMDANGHRTRAAAGAVAYGVGTSYTLNGAGTEATYLGPIDPLSNAPEGLGVIGINGVGGRGLLPNVTDQFNDPTAFDQVGKVGIGDIELSGDGKFLFVMNLYERKLFRLELDNAANPLSVIAVTSYALPPIVVNNGVLRPFGLAFHRNKIYIGAVSSGENGGQNIVNGATDLYAYVFEMTDPTGAAVINPTPILTFPLNYKKGFVVGGVPGYDQWYPWNKNTANLLLLSEETLPGPMLSDIEFTDRGDMILDFCDRSGHQFSGNSRQDLSGMTMVGSYDVGGDILMAGLDCGTGTFTLETNGGFLSNGSPFVGGVGTMEGPGGGEFFFEDYWVAMHHETSVGSAAVLRGRGEVLVTLMDPIDAFSNGTGKFSTATGLASGHLTVAGFTEFGKANSLGDIEVAGDAVTLQIGNRVWKDDDGDGIQDPGENGINNVSVDLYADFDNNNIPDGAILGSTLTAGDGNWNFDAANIPDGDPSVAGIQAGPIPGKMYIVQIGSADWSAGSGINDLQGMRLTLADVGGAGQPDVRDNDANLISNQAVIKALTKRYGENDHNWDFGFMPCPKFPDGDIYLDCNTLADTLGPIATPGDSYSWSPGTGLSATNISQPIASPGVTTIYTLTVNNLCTKEYTVFVDNAPPSIDAGPSKNIDCDLKGVVIGSPAVAGYTYLWSPAAGLDNPTLAQPTATPYSTTTYTLTVTGGNGCTSNAEVTVKVDLCCSHIEVPNAFSPNGDNRNDKFGVVVIENVNNFYLTVYNRWGQKLFESDKVDLRWDGTFNGKPCELGTYFYIIRYDCKSNREEKFLKGDVSLVR